MSKARTQVDEKQISLFTYLEPETPPQPGSMDISIRIRHAVSNSILKCGKSRIDICAEIYKLTGQEIPKSTLDGWSAESRDLSNDNIDFNGNRRRGIPGEIIPAFCAVTGDWEALFIVVDAANFKAMKGRDVVRARIGLLKEEITQKTQELKGLEKALVKTPE